MFFCDGEDFEHLGIIDDQAVIGHIHLKRGNSLFDDIGQFLREHLIVWIGNEVIVSDTIVNVQTGTGNRIEFWDRNGVPLLSKGKIRRFIDVGRLTKGR